MGTDWAQSLTLHLSAVLAMISMQAVATAVFRIIRTLPPADALAQMRMVTLLAFALFMLGAAAREAVVVVAGVEAWSYTPIVWSGVARAVQLAGAVLFIWNITRGICGNWLWTMSLGVAVAFSILVIR